MIQNYFCREVLKKLIKDVVRSYFDLLQKWVQVTPFLGHWIHYYSLLIDFTVLSNFLFI